MDHPSEVRATIGAPMACQGSVGPPRVSSFEQTRRRPRCSYYCMWFKDGNLGGSVRRLESTKGTPSEELIPGHALIFRGVTEGLISDPPYGYERAGRGFGICQQLGLWRKRCGRPLCL